MGIKAQDITKVYGKEKALDGVSFSIETGEIVGFLGPNGAGKTTMMKIITGFIPQTSGEVTVNGLSVITNSLEVKKQIGYLPENNPLYDELYVREYLKYVAGLYKTVNKRERMEEIIEMTGLHDEQKKKIGQLSKGFKQRVGLAQALIHDPEVLILDEPTSGLDPNQIVEIRNLISRVGKQKTVLLSTHIMQEVEAICDRVIIIKEGRIVADDDKGNMLKYIDEEYQTVLVEFDKDVSKEKIEEVAFVVRAVPVNKNQWLVQGQQEHDVRSKIFNFAVENKLTVLVMQKQEKSLEEVFRMLTVER
ncbi:MAG: gliding motility-associated ABC transporter ATP-binding subunit GldA [Bacteroidales bacterium]|nr:gliding motility-associated ABC transporter ATP-binding subunit GldA [Bacteroidales bacterium]